MRKVCIITSVHPPFDVRVFYREAISLARNHFCVSLVVSSDQGEFIAEGIQVLGIRGSKSSIWRYLRSWKFFVAALRRHADIYHFHDPELMPVCALLQIITRKPVVYDVHEHYPDAIMIRERIPRLARGLISRVFDFFERRMVSCFNALIVADDALAARFEPLHKTVITLHNYPRADFCSYNRVHRATVVGNALRLAYAGVISAERGLWLMLELVRILITEEGIDANLLLAGAFSSRRIQEDFEQRIRSDKCLNGCVEWHGVVPHSQLADWLTLSNIGLVPLQPIPKFFKNVPTKMFEYMAAGLPIVASDLPPIRKYLGTAKAGFLAIPEDPHSHAEKVVCLARNQSIATEMANNGRRAFKQRYNWNAEEAKLLSLYNNLLSNLAPSK